MTLNRRALLTGLTASLAIAWSCGQETDDASWPTQPVRLIVPFGPGNSADLAARLFAALLAPRWHQAVVVDNRPGADGVVGTQAFVTARDRHALLFAPMGMITVNPLLHAQIPFDAQQDVVPIASAVRPSIGIAVGPMVRARSLGELIAEARLDPGKWLWAATPGLPELVFRALLKMEQLDLQHVAYGDLSPAIRDLDDSRIQVVVAAVPTLTPVLAPAHSRLLAVTTSQRNVAWPDVPTVREAGYPALTVDGPYGFFGWRGISETLKQRIAADLQSVAGDAALSKRLRNVGFALDTGTPASFAEAIQAQRRQVEELARLVGLPANRQEAR